MATAKDMTDEEPPALWVVLTDSPTLAIETALASGCPVDVVVGRLSEETVDQLGRGQATLISMLDAWQTRTLLPWLLNAVIFTSMTQTLSTPQFLMVMQSISRSFSCLQTASASPFCWKPAKRAR
jgi:hypothetical protein